MTSMLQNGLAHRDLRPHYGTATLVQVNDERGHAAVIALFDEVMAAELSDLASDNL